MMCKKPFMQGPLAFGCGQCLPCRLNRRRLWSHRLMLEGLSHEKSCFVTLTYSDENLPAGATLDPKHVQLWLKRLRTAVDPIKLRFYLVGEYGDLSQRPHYHLALYGLDETYADIIRGTWGLGNILVGTLTHDSAQYIAGYVTKKMTKKDDPRLNGRYPEFARMSLRPGIGALAMKTVAVALTTDAGADEILNSGDVPMSLKHGSKNLPLGRYIRKKLREELGFKETGSQKEQLQKLSEEMSILLENALQDRKNRSLSFKKILLKLNKQKVLNLEARSKIFSKKGSI